MTRPEQDETNDEFVLGDVFKPLVKYRRVIWLGTLGVTLLAMIVGGLYYFLQPVRWTASVGFRPVFTGADVGEYPNKLPFASTDITDPTVIGQIFEKNHLQDYCTADQFQSAFFVEESSPELQFLDLEYQGRLADPRITAVDRQRLQDEYKAASPDARGAIQADVRSAGRLPAGAARRLSSRHSERYWRPGRMTPWSSEAS